ncbi:MAG TPA: T9SS type A sorting domain-containing protein [Chitinophagales bacterium]|nr:T9SS type A sorting domain-containing protein [Chitinophagales bacterium]
MRKTCTFILLSFVFSFSVSAQNTFSTVRSILQANCAASGCHGGGNANVFDVDAASSDLYHVLVDVPAANAAAAAKGNKIVDPGHPYNSFLLRKIGSSGFDPYITIDDSEKNGHPDGSLQDYEIELIRQWIIAGAQETGNVVDYQLLQDYYTNGGLDFIPIPQAPAPGKGFQVRLGPIFFGPNAEAEFMKKEHLKNQSTLIVSEMSGYMSWESHHMLLFKFNGIGSGEREGTRRVPLQAFPFNGDITLTGAWQNDGDFKLPQGTAFYWQPGTVLDFDYHVKNYSQTQILPADFYLNIFYNDDPTPPVEMFAELENEVALALNPGENFESREHHFNEDRYIWMLSSHTHKYGTDYDIFIRNQDGTKGNQIYEGFYNESYTFNQGFYDYQHPPIRYFEPMLKVENGLIFETAWNVTGPCTSPLQPLFCITFGMTTDDEMMLFTYLYTKEKVESPTGISSSSLNATDFSVYPNPFFGVTRVNYSIAEVANVKLEVYDVLGKKLSTIYEMNQQAAGNYSSEISSKQIGDAPGVYFITLTLDGKQVSTRKITRL